MATPPGAPAQKVPEVKIGDLVLDRYRVVEQIGSGGHSVVFRGTDERLARPVCVKVFSGLGGLSGVGRTSYEHFVQEAFALSRLTHPNTLRIYDFGHLGPKDAAGMPLQVCEYMNGGTLSQIIREQGKQGLPQTVRVIAAMCAALSEAHGLGIVHRDIKPQNILFGSVGETRLPKLADFGIAKWSADTDADREQRAEDTAIVAGQKLAMYSPSWAAPEQLAGQPVSAATDIYSLAVVAIYMLTTKAIFADEDVYAGYKKRRHAGEHIQAALAPLGLPRNLTELLSRALAFDPKQRLVRVDDLATALEQLLDRSAAESERLPAPAAPMSSQHPPPSVSATRDPVTPPAIAVATAPMPPVIPMPMDMTPQTFHAPATQAWMTNAPVPTGAVRRLPLADGAQAVADRRVHFAMVTSGIADLVGLHGTKVRVTLIPGPGGARNVHVKGLTCFIAPLGGRPSPAVSLTQSGDLALVTPRAQEIGHLRVIQGALEGPLVTFAIGNERVGVGLDDVADPILFDFGPGSDAYIVYTRGRTVPRPGRRG
jgi:serine/threonine protein kinase